MKRYLIWKNGTYNGDDTEWEEISGEKYYAIVDDPENKRLFVSFKDKEDKYADEFVYEVTEDRYKIWDRDRKREEYKQKEKAQHPIEMVSLEDIVCIDDNGEPVTLGDLIPAPEPNPAKEIVDELLAMLPPFESKMIRMYFLDNPRDKKVRKTQKQIAAELGITQQAFAKRLRKIKEKMRAWF